MWYTDKLRQDENDFPLCIFVNGDFQRACSQTKTKTTSKAPCKGPTKIETTQIDVSVRHLFVE